MKLIIRTVVKARELCNSMLHDENNYTYFQYINSIVLFTNIL